MSAQPLPQAHSPPPIAIRALPYSSVVPFPLSIQILLGLLRICGWYGVEAMQRRAVRVRGVVQGVGFRPFIYGLATHWQLGGFVRNQQGAVEIEIEGPTKSLDGFLHQLRAHPPPLARIEELEWEPREVLRESTFRIETSASDASPVFISPDMAVCDACLAEMFNSADRRWHYPLLNCTHCGPRLTIITGAPYDRENTTMASFVMCQACREEYEDPTNRRFHAQPTACPNCGPQLALCAADGSLVATQDPLSDFAAAIQAGHIGALKGLGGYHLVCDAQNHQAVAELRRRKARDEKPLAIMAADIPSARAVCHISPEEQRLLESPRRPIVLLRKRADHPIAEQVAPGSTHYGVMLPYTPLHHLLMRKLNGMPLVMTSGNHSDEPIAYEDRDAAERLGAIADVLLIHNRPIAIRCDDSVTRIVDGHESPVRRSRGYAPEPIALPFSCSLPMLAVGGQLKSTFALGRHQHAIVSHHLGDLDHWPAYQAFERDLQHYERLFSITPELIACDLHPDYASTRYAHERAQRTGCRLLAVQHHHAHLASCLAENGVRHPVIGVIWDGAGYGTDGAVWGGEFLVGDCRSARRAASFRYVHMPGGEQAIRHPWRMALAHLVDAGLDEDLLRERVNARELQTVRAMLERSFNSPRTSSVGRLFDTVASLAAVRDHVAYEGQAAVELEWLASNIPPGEGYPWELSDERSENSAEPQWIIDTRPLIREVAQERCRNTNRAWIARRFHSTLVEILLAVCRRIREDTGLSAVALSGGVFLNALLTSESARRLANEGFQIYRHRVVPANDGGLSLGQLAVVAAQLPA